MLLPWRIASIALATALAQLATRPAEAQVAVAQATVPTLNIPWIDRDANDPRERFLLLTPGGPIVVECELTFNGEPFRVLRERLVQALLDEFDKNEQGQPVWEKTLTNPRSSLRRTIPRQTAVNAGLIAKQFDVNGDGLADRMELCRLLYHNFRDDFSLATNPYGTSAAPKLGELFDTDGDRTLTAEEIAAASERLKTRDQDDNDVITAAELGGQSAMMYRVARATGAQPGDQLTILLGPAADLPAAFKTVQDKYRDQQRKLRAGCFPLVPKLVEQLDADRNGEIDRSEFAGFNTIPPHVVCEVPLTDKSKTPGIRLKAMAPELESIAKVEVREGNQISVQLPSLVLTVKLSLPPTTSQDVYRARAQAIMDRFDKDKNGYLEATEVAGQAGFAGMFESWDNDRDGKVYVAEIVAFEERQSSLTQTQFNAMVADQGSPLLSKLDTSGDGKLGLREIRAAADQLRTYDVNHDGAIAPDEIPRQLSLTIGRGNIGRQGDYVALTNYAAGQTAPPTKSDWFTSMDRNGDGDISRREFLGALDKFDQLDANRDGLLDRTETGADK